MALFCGAVFASSVAFGPIASSPSAETKGCVTIAMRHSTMCDHVRNASVVSGSVTAAFSYLAASGIECRKTKPRSSQAPSPGWLGLAADATPGSIFRSAEYQWWWFYFGTISKSTAIPWRRQELMASYLAMDPRAVHW